MKPNLKAQSPSPQSLFSLSRIYEGIHFRFADEDTRKQGRHVAEWLFGHFLKPIDE